MASGERTVRIKFDGTSKGLAAAAARAKAELKAFQRDLEKHEKAVAAAARESEAAAATLAEARSKRFAKFRSDLMSISASVTSFMAKTMAGLASLNSGIGVLAGIASWASAASGALFLIPGALAAGVAGMVAWKLGADGIKKAFEGVNPQLDRLKANVSATFRSELQPAVRDINALLPQTTGHFQGVAKAISSTITGFTAMAREKSNVAALNSTLDNSSGFIRNVGKALAPLGRAFLDLAQVGSGAMKRLTDGIGGAAQRFSDFIRQSKESGKIDSWIEEGIAAFKDLWALLSDVGSIVSEVFGALREGGAGVAPILGPAIDTIKKFVQSPEGQETFRTLGETLAKVGEAVSRILGPALKAIGPIIEPLGKLVGTLATHIADYLGPAFEKIGQIAGPLVEALSPFVEQIVKALLPIIPSLVGQLGQFAAIAILLTPVLMSLTIPIQLAIAGMVALTQVMRGDVVGAAETMKTGFSNASATMKSVTETDWGTMAAKVAEATSNIDLNVSDTANGMSGDWGNGLSIMGGDTSNSMSGLLGQFRGTMPQIPGIAGQGSSGAAERFGLGMDQMNGAANSGIGSLMQKVVSLPGKILRSLGDLGSLLFHSGASLLAGLGRGIESMVGKIVGKVTGFLGKVRGLFPFSPAKEGPFSGKGWVLFSGLSIGQAFADGIGTSTGSAVNAATKLQQRISDVLTFDQGSFGRAVAARTTSGSSTAKPQHFTFNLDLGEGITQRVEASIDSNNRATARLVGMGPRR